MSSNSRNSVALQMFATKQVVVTESGICRLSTLKSEIRAHLDLLADASRLLERIPTML